MRVRSAPTGPLCVGNSQLAGSNGFIVIGKNDGSGGARSQYIGYNTSFELVIGDYGGGSGPLIEAFKLSYNAPVNSLVINSGGNISMPNTVSIGTDRWHSSTEGASRVYYSPNNTTYLRGHGGTSFVFRNGADGDIASINSGGYLTLSSGATINGDTFISSSRLVLRGTAPTLYLRDTDNRSGMIHMNSNIMYFLNGSGNDSETWAQQNGQDWALQINMNNNTATFGGGIVCNAQSQFNANCVVYGGLYVRLTNISATNTDYVCVAGNTAFQSVNDKFLYIANGNFTGFHRNYTDDELFDPETPELFKNNFAGCIVISTGKIKTDYSTIEEELNENNEIKNKVEWKSAIDKEGISIEDALPIVFIIF